VAGARCIKATDGNTCQPPEKKTCALNSDCTPGLVCGADLQCRNQCSKDIDCLKGQKCTTNSKLCADPITDKEYDPATNELKNAVDGGATGSGGAAGDAAGSGGSNADGGSDSPLDISSDAPASLDGTGAVLEGVAVTPNASVRPGQGNITITVNQAAGGLASPTVFELGGLTVRADAASTDTMLVLKISVPHGAALGKRSLKFASAGGLFMAADVLEVTAITVAPAGVDSNPGSAASPFKTLKQAILTSGGGDTIHLLDGTYNLASGETWGYTIPDNLTIVGDSTEGTIIDGAGASGNPNGFDASAALTLKSLTIQHFYNGIDMKKPSATVTMEDVALISHSYYGINIETAAMGSTVNFSGAKGLINQPGHQAMYIYAVQGVTINVTNGKLQGGSYVIQFGGNCSGTKLNITNTTIEQLAMNSYDAVYVGVSGNAAGTEIVFNNVTVIGGLQDLDPKGTFTITGGTITAKYGIGIDFSAKSLSVTGTTISMMSASAGISFHTEAQGLMSLKNVTVDGGGYGVQQTAKAGSAKLRGTTIKNTAYHGYYLSAGDLDLGTAAESGDNIFGAPTSTNYYCLAIQRGTGANAGAPVTCSGTAFAATGPNDGQRPAPAMISADSGVITQAPQLYYVGTGDKLNFY
jgi:hypothetical protein